MSSDARTLRMPLVQAEYCKEPLNFSAKASSYSTCFGGDLASTWVAKLEVHAEVRFTS